MSETGEQKPFATSGSGKSDAEVAFDLLNKLKGQGIWGEKNKPEILDMYAECLDAVKGYRVYEGQNRLLAPIRQAPNPASRKVTQPVPAQPQAQAQPANPAQVQSQVPAQASPQAPQGNPVQAQHHLIQQQIQRQG